MRLRAARATIVGRGQVPLAAAVGPEAGAVFGELHRAHGVKFRFGETVAEVRPAGGDGAGSRY